MGKQSALRAKQQANAAERAQARDTGSKVISGIRKKTTDARTLDSFQNFMANLGVGTNNMMSASTYGFNPISRQRVLLEWIHRGSWLGGVAVDVVADDMTRAGLTILGENTPEEKEAIQRSADDLDIWGSTNDNVRWSRLYGGCVAVDMVAGQNYSTPLKLETVDKNQYRGQIVIDRWMLEPSLNDLVADEGPHMGQPKFYKVMESAPGLRGKTIHYSRLTRLSGVKLPYWQRVTENLWGISELERIYDRLIAFDSATTGAAQLVYKAYVRTYKIKDLNEVVSLGGDAMKGLLAKVEAMRLFQSMEGITLLDSEDDFAPHQAPPFAGLAEALVHLGQQISGALQIPLVRLFGQSPAGLNSTGDSDIRTYYDAILQRQNRTLRHGLTRTFRLLAANQGIKLAPNFGIEFNPLWQLTEAEKAEIAAKDTQTADAGVTSGLVTPATGMRELLDRSRVTGRWSNIPREQIQEADELEQVPMATNVEVAEVKAGLQPAAKEDDDKGKDKPTGGGKDAAFVESEHPRNNLGEFAKNQEGATAWAKANTDNDPRNPATPRVLEPATWGPVKNWLREKTVAERQAIKKASPVRTLDPNKLVSAQNGLRVKALMHFINNPDEINKPQADVDEGAFDFDSDTPPTYEEYPVGVETAEGIHIVNGNHRASAAKLLGQEVKVRVVPG